MSRIGTNHHIHQDNETSPETECVPHYQVVLSQLDTRGMKSWIRRFPSTVATSQSWR